ncbi:hypothetical protein M0R45_014572 [Rubus argutus]|uniref:Uncharacterized protein n=1 Tax=Rubus argutus TaxID=59490 RepID=A0AAW1XN12_RUBAR
MALAMRGFIIGAPKPNTVKIPSCNYYQRNSMIMLQTHHDHKHARNISRSIVTRAEKPPLSSGEGPKINQTKPADKHNVSDSSSSNSQKDGKEGKGDANTAPKTSGATN